MSFEEEPRPKKVSKEEFDIISNRLAVALAKRESLIKSWTASSSRPSKTKTLEEREAEDEILFQNQPPYLGVGAPIPAHFLTSDANQNNKSLRAKFFPTKGLKASKARDAEEKAASAKRAKREEESDEEQGRSGLGRAKKLKSKPRIVPVMKEHSGEEKQSSSDEGGVKLSSSKIQKPSPEPVNVGKKQKLSPEPVKEIKSQRITAEPAKSIEAAVEAKEVLAEHDINKVSGGSSSSLEVPGEDSVMEDTKSTEGSQEPLSHSTSTHTLNAEERKKIKRREQKKRAKLRKQQAQQTQ